MGKNTIIIIGELILFVASVRSSNKAHETGDANFTHLVYSSLKFSHITLEHNKIVVPTQFCL